MSAEVPCVRPTGVLEGLRASELSLLRHKSKT